MLFCVTVILAIIGLNTEKTMAGNWNPDFPWIWKHATWSCYKYSYQVCSGLCLCFDGSMHSIESMLIQNKLNVLIPDRHEKENFTFFII